ncbi:MAG TPA: AI-2E family transporter, partial [Dehalococcoidia bacterium]
MPGGRGILLVRIELNFRNLLLLFALLVVAWVTYLVRDTIVLLGLALMLMATLHPLVQMAERRGLSHSWAVALVMLALVLVPVAMIAAMTPIIISEVQSFAKSFPTLQQHINELLHNWGVADRVNQ